MASQFGRGLTIGRKQPHNSTGRRASNVSHPSTMRQSDIENVTTEQPQDDIEEFVEVRHSIASRRSSRSSFALSHRHGGSLHHRPTSTNSQPHRRHGHETFGDLMLHPIKEYELHRQRLHEYQEEKKNWIKEHLGDPEKASDTPPVPEPSIEAS